MLELLKKILLDTSMRARRALKKKIKANTKTHRNYMNDGLRTDIFLRYSPEIIACACIYLSARELQIPLPENPPWYTIFGGDEKSIKAICIRILHLYTHKTRSQEEVEKIINDCRNRIESEKKKAKEATSSPIISETNQQIEQTKTVVSSEEIKKTTEQIKQISASITKAQAKASPNPPLTNLPPSHGYHHHHQSHHMTRHASFNYNYYGHPHPAPFMAHMDPYYGTYSDHYYNEMMYEGTLKRNKSASYLISSHNEYDYKRDKERGKGGYKEEYSKYRSASRSRSRSKSRSRKVEKKSSKHRSRSRTVESIENGGSRDSRSPSRHKKKKSHHHKEEKRRDRSRDKKERERSRDKTRDRSRDRHHHHHKSSKHSKDKHESSDSRYVPIYS
ncbi:unnamed protein product [Brachionus calyciflorus]|uniref:Cyclin-like domain-containing protein n=1 Tax=Brachionus calyciflorus TaxID=104777 RepID=A0A814AZZ8_9BILA|nr:unnamed protein product [Brachionus calyciflorus]